MLERTLLTAAAVSSCRMLLLLSLRFLTPLPLPLPLPPVTVPRPRCLLSDSAASNDRQGTRRESGAARLRCAPPRVPATASVATAAGTDSGTRHDGGCRQQLVYGARRRRVQRLETPAVRVRQLQPQVPTGPVLVMSWTLRGRHGARVRVLALSAGTGAHAGSTT